MDKVNALLAQIRDKLNASGTHMVLCIVLALISAKTPDAYQWIPDMLLAIFAAIGVNISAKQKNKVNALLDSHAESVQLVEKIANDAGLDTSGLQAAMAHPVIEKAIEKADEHAPPATP